MAGDTNNLSDVFVRDAWYGVTTRVSVAANGAQANDASSRARISKDGRFVTFTSFAKNLVPGDDDFSEDVFIRDMATGAIEMAPSLPGGRSAADDISDDGRIVGFTSLGRLRLDDTNGVQDAFVFDRGMDIVKQVSVSSANVPGNSNSEDVSASSDGRYVVFWSRASNLVLGDLNNAADVFVRDMQTGITSAVSVTPTGSLGTGSSPSISSDGRFIAFHSGAADIVASDSNGTSDIFVRDMTSGVTTLVSKNATNALGNGASSSPLISGNGRYVTYHSSASNLVPGDTNNQQDVFVYDRETGVTRLVSMDGAGNQANGVNSAGGASEDGRFVSYESNATNLATGDTNFFPDVFLADAGYLPPNPIPTLQTLGTGSEFAARPVSYQADPVNSATGAFTTEVTDASWPALGIPFALTRTYNSNDPVIGPLGPGWTHAYTAALEVNGPTVILRAGDGQQVQWTTTGDGSYLGGPGVTASLIKAGDNTYAVTTKARIRYAFDDNGRLTAITDRNGQGLTLSYDVLSGRLAQVAGSGRSATFAYNGDGTIESVQFSDGRSVAYGYSAARLASVRDVRGFTWSYSYDSAGRLATIQDPNGHFYVRLAYDPTTGRVTDQWDARNNHSSFSWDATTQTASVTAPRGGVWKDTYSGNVLVSQTDPLGNVTTFEYDRSYRLSRVIDPRGATSSFSYDRHGNITADSTPDGVSRFFTYDGNHNMTSSTNGRGTTVVYGHDDSGNLIQTIRHDPADPGSAITTVLTRHPSSGLITAATDPLGHTTRFAYNSNGDLTAVCDAAGNVTSYSYDAAGRVISVVDPRGNTGLFVETPATPRTECGATESPQLQALYRWRYTYDPAGRPTSVIDPLDHEWTAEYDPAGRLVTMRDANGRVTTVAYNEANQVLSVQPPDPDVPPTQLEYDSDGNAISVTDGNGHRTVSAYDLAERLTSVTSPLGTWTFGYDTAGNRTAITGPDTTAVNLTYDLNNRIKTITYPDGSPAVAYAYDANGNRASMTDGAGIVSYTYDALDRPTAVRRQGVIDEEIKYGYDRAGNLTARINADGSTDQFTYGETGLLSTVVRFVAEGQSPVAVDGLPVEAALIPPDGPVTSYLYDAAGHLISTKFPNNLIESRTWDQAGRLTGIRTVGPGLETTASGTAAAPRPIAGKTYVLDPVGNPTTVIDADNVLTNYEYDALDRLTQVCFSAPCAAASDFIRWAYDAVGNRLSETRPTGSTTYTYNAADQLVEAASSAGSSTTYTYDADGNQVTAGPSSFTYAKTGRMKSATVNGTTTNYSYDGDGRRLTATSPTSETIFSWDPFTYQLLLEGDGNQNNATVRQYIYGVGLVGMATPQDDFFYYHNDAVGSPLAVTNSTGNAQWTYDWEPFGRARSTTQVTPNAPTNPIGWTSSYSDSTGLSHLRARQYDSSTGRFTSVDPGGTGDPYSYGANNPMMNTDPLGLAPSGRDIVQLVNTVARGIGTTAAGVAIACTAAIICAPAAPIAGTVAAGAGAITAGTSIALATDTCSSHKGSCAAAVIGAAIDTAFGAVAWSAIPSSGMAPDAAASLVDDAVRMADDWLGPNGRSITNRAGDKVFLSDDGMRRIRVDINNPAPHTSPHAHIEELINGRWVKSGPIYPRDVPQR